MIRERAAKFRGFVEREKNSGRRWDAAVADLIDDLVIAFFVAMVVVWAITMVVGVL